MLTTGELERTICKIFEAQFPGYNLTEDVNFCPIRYFNIIVIAAFPDVLQALIIDIAPLKMPLPPP